MSVVATSISGYENQISQSFYSNNMYSSYSVPYFYTCLVFSTNVTSCASNEAVNNILTLALTFLLFFLQFRVHQKGEFLPLALDLAQTVALDHLQDEGVLFVVLNHRKDR